MATETTTPTTTLDVTPPTITRNGTSKQLSKCVFSPKSDNYKGVQFFAPELADIKVEDVKLEDGSTVKGIIDPVVINDIIWTGGDQISGATNKTLRQVFGTMTTDNMERNDGVLNLEEFLTEAADFTAARQSLSDLRTELDDLQALQQTYSMDENFGAEEEITEEGTGEKRMVKTERAVELEKLIKANADKIRPLRVKIEALKKQYEIVSEKRNQTKEANKAKKEAAKGGQVATA